MNSYDRGVLFPRLRLALVGTLAVCFLGIASAASAAGPSDPDGDPPPSALKANLLFTSASVALVGTQWEIRYTVANLGTKATPLFHVSVQQDPSTPIKETYHASMAPGASRSEIIHVSVTGCYVAVRFTADSTHVVTESREDDNVHTAIALTSPACSTQPKYKVKAISFHVSDESGIDWLGSDEPYWIFSSVGTAGTAHTTASHVFGDIDTGDTASFSPTEGCLYLNCVNGGAAPFGLGISIQLWEQDNGEVARVLADTAPYFTEAGAITGPLPLPSWVSATLSLVGQAMDYIAGWAQDDLLGSQTFTYSPALLASRLPAVGGTFNDTRTYSGAPSSGGAVYDMTVAVTRVA